VLNHALAKNPEERLPTASAVMDELEAAIGGAQLAPPPTTGATPKQKGSSGDQRPQQRTATAGFGTPALPAAGATVIDRPPTASKVGPRPRAPRNRKPMLVSLATMLIALAAACGAVLAFTQEDHPAPAAKPDAHKLYVAAVDKVMRPLKPQVESTKQQLNASEDPPGQQAAAEGLAQLYASSAARIQAIKPPAADAANHAKLLQGLGDANTWYTSVAKAVRNNSSSGFSIAIDETEKAERAINDALTAIYGSAQ
jgi:hypothetical protein